MQNAGFKMEGAVGKGKRRAQLRDPCLGAARAQEERKGNTFLFLAWLGKRKIIIWPCALTFNQRKPPTFSHLKARLLFPRRHELRFLREVFIYLPDAPSRGVVRA
jgi:hypothetical protein